MQNKKPAENKNGNDCCAAPKKGAKNKTILQGAAFGLIPHIGCIVFIVGSVLGATFLTQLFRPLLMNPYFFHILVGISFALATISSAFYLRKNGLLFPAGIMKKWRYLSAMYGSTIGANLLLFFVIFPATANLVVSQPAAGLSAAPQNAESIATLRLSVDIPCSGHAPLISQELKTVDGVSGIKFTAPNIFDVTYDSAKTSKQQILSLEVFKTYKASVLSELAASAPAGSQQLSAPAESGVSCSAVSAAASGQGNCSTQNGSAPAAPASSGGCCGSSGCGCGLK